MQPKDKLSGRAAYCDVDGTLAATTIVTPLLWYKRRAPHKDTPWLASLPLRGPWWLMLDKISRDASNRSIYRSYAGMDVAEITASARDCFDACIRPRLFPAALEKMAALRGDGVKIVLVTGSLDFLMRPLAEMLDADLIAPSLAVKDGRYTGELTSPPLAGERKAVEIRSHAQTHGIDLAQCWAFGDAPGDAQMLHCVGHPVAVNPGSRMKRLAQKHHWQIEHWRK